jgi:hypothetical protein
MRVYSVEERRRNCWSAAVLAVLLGIGLFFYCMLPNPQGQKMAARRERTAYLSSLGWDCDAQAETHRRVKLPDCSTGSMKEYNDMQRVCGYDLAPYAGKTVDVYSLPITNYPGWNGTVYAVVYLYRGRLIGGDIHAAALDGFMIGLESRS